MQFIEKFWRSAKCWNKLQLGPVSLYYHMGRSKYISNNTRRKVSRFFRNIFTLSTPIPTAHSPLIRKKDKHFAALTPAAPGETALVIGVGPGLGFSIARKLAASGFQVALASRNAERLDPLVSELKAMGGTAQAYGCDATDEKSVRQLMSLVSAEFGVPHLVIYSIQQFCPGRVIDVEVSAFESCWRHNCLGGFIVAKEASNRMMPLGRGTIVLTGSTSALIGRADHLNLAVGKFGLRALSQVLARELWSSGIHVAHLVIDADIKEDEVIDRQYPQSDPDHISEIIHMLHRQPKSAWTSELDVRPWNENFWEHC